MTFYLQKDYHQLAQAIVKRNLLPIDYREELDSEFLFLALECFLLSLNSDLTRKKYAQVILHFNQFMQNTKNKLLDAAVGDDVLRWREDLLATGGVAGLETEKDLTQQKPNDINTVENKTSALSSFYAYLLKPGVVSGRVAIKYNPVDALPKRATIEKYGKSIKITLPMFKKILEVIDSKDLKNYCLFLGYYLTGMRFSELVKLRNSEINFNSDPPVFQYVGKGRKVSNKKIPAILWEALQKIELKTNNDYYFSIDGKKPFSENYVLSQLKKYAKKAGLSDDVTIHSLRHLHAETALDLGINLEAVRSSLKHNNLNTTQIYAGSLGDAKNPLANHLVQSIIKTKPPQD